MSMILYLIYKLLHGHMYYLQRAEGESLYIRYNTDANVVNDLKNDSSYEFIGEIILKINVV
jgi:hypothetical protein